MPSRTSWRPQGCSVGALAMIGGRTLSRIVRPWVTRLRTEWPAVLAKEPVEDPAYTVGFGREQAVARQEVAGMQVGNRQRVAVRSHRGSGSGPLSRRSRDRWAASWSRERRRDADSGADGDV